MKLRLSAAFILVVVSIAGCGRKSDGDAPLAFAPADTPYVFANLEPVPEGVSRSWYGLMEPMNAALATSIAALRTELAAHPDAQAEQLLALMTLAEGRLSFEGMEKIGIHHDARAALYGVNLVPVLRIELADADAFRAFIADLGQRRGSPLPVAETEGHKYWRVELKGGLPTLIVAIVERHLVVTQDAGAKGPPLAELLGLKRPAHSLRDSGELAQIGHDYHFAPYGIFLIDMRRLAGALQAGDGKDAGFAALLAAHGAALSPACRHDLAGIAEAVPRMVGGYDKLDAKSLAMTSVVELRPDLLQGLAAIPAPVPGLGGGNDRAGIDFGFGARLDKLADFIRARAAAIESAPWQCEWLAALNQGAGSAGAQISALQAAAGWFSGARIALTDLKWTGKKPEAIAAALVIASPNPAGLIAMAQGFVPQLAGLNLKPDAPPQPLDLGPLTASFLPEASRATVIAVREGGVGIAVGADAQKSVLEHLTAKSSAPPPLFHLGYDGATYSLMLGKFDEMTESLSAEARKAAAAANPERAQGPDVDAALRPVRQALNAVVAGMQQTWMDVVVTERGLEVREQVRLK